MSKILLILSLLFTSCLSQQRAGEGDCITIGYKDSTDYFKIIQRTVFDTTASLVHATVIDKQSGKLLSGVQMQIDRGNDIIKARSGKNGVVYLFRNGIEGISGITFSAKGYSCLTINQFEISGGQILSVRLRKR